MPDAFISVQDLTDKLGRDVTSDAGAQFAIEAACGVIRDITDQDFTLGTSTVALDGQGGDALALPQQPVSKVGTVTMNGGTVTDYMVTSHGLLLRGSAGHVSTWGGWRPPWPRGRQNIVVTYEHGYGTADIPKSLKMVALSIAERLVVQGVAQAEVIGDAQITYAVAESDLTAGELRIIKGNWRPQSF